MPLKSPSYAFVEFEDLRDAEDTITGRDGYNFDGYPLRVEPAYEERKSSSYSESSRRGASRHSDYKGWPIGTTCVGNLPVAEVVDEVEDDRQMIVDSNAKIEECPKKSYASIISNASQAE